MNHFILKYGYPITAVILAVFAWVVYQRISRGWSDVVVLAIAAVIVYALGVPAFLYFWPRLTVNGYKRSILKQGLGGGPIPVNTLYAVPETASASAARGSLMATGAEDLLYVGGWLDLRKGPQVLHAPDMGGRYYNVQFTDPSQSANFAYVGKRTTGTKSGDYVLSGPGWKGTVPNGMTQISSPTNSVLIIGRVFVESDGDLTTAYALAKQIQLRAAQSVAVEAVSPMLDGERLAFRGSWFQGDWPTRLTLLRTSTITPNQARKNFYRTRSRDSIGERPAHAFHDLLTRILADCGW